MALVRSPLGKNALRFSNKTRGSSFLNVDYRNAVPLLFLSRECRSGTVPTDQGNSYELFSSSPPSRAVTAGLPACYATAPLFMSSTRRKCRVKPKPSRMSWAERTTLGERCVLRHIGGPGPVLCVRSYSGHNNNSTPLYKTKTGYYDVLEVASSATHAQIKTAYYKQSFRYHPDKNAGSEAASRRFSDISEAYNVLGNKALKRKYDRGILSPGDLVGGSGPASAKEASGSSSAAQQPPTDRQSVMGVDSQRVFDFDKFIKAHYGGQLQKQRDVQVRKEEMMRKKEADMREMKFENILEMSVGLLVVFAVTILFSLKKAN